MHSSVQSEQLLNFRSRMLAYIFVCVLCVCYSVLSTESG